MKGEGWHFNQAAFRSLNSFQVFQDLSIKPESTDELKKNFKHIWEKNSTKCLRFGEKKSRTE